MPAIKYSEEEKRYRLLKGNIAKRQDALQVTDKQMASYTGLNIRTYQKKRAHPELFKYPELIKVFKRLDFPDNEILETTKL